MKFVTTGDVNKIITINLNDRIGNLCKFYSLSEINEETPIEIKFLVLDNSRNIKEIEQKLRLMEQTAIKE